MSRPSVKVEKRYEALREEAAPYEDWAKADLYEKAQKVGIEGRSDMTKSELISALRIGS